MPEAKRARGEKQVPNRHTVLLVLLAAVGLLAGCKKSSESDAPNFFGSPPVVTELSITKESKSFTCTNPAVELCCVDFPTCSCCCGAGDQVDTITAALDLVKMSAKVVDSDGAANILVVLARFFDPPTATPGAPPIDEVSLEMFDVGANSVGFVRNESTGNTFPIITGDAIQSDGVYTRYFYMKSDTLSQPGECIFSTDTTELGGTYSQFGTTTTFPATSIINFNYHVEAVDRGGNITPSPEVTLPIVKSVVTVQTVLKPCGPPVPGTNGCLPPP
jgi:hypothetical protein